MQVSTQGVSPLHSGELRHGTFLPYVDTQVFTKINNVYGKPKDQMKLDLCICETLSYMHITMETAFVSVGMNNH